MWDIKCIIEDLLKSRSVQDFINRRFKDENTVILDIKGQINYVSTKNGDLFFISKHLNSVNTVYQDYIFDDIRKEDIVIDVGANIGGFSIPASRLCDHLGAVEPITTEELRKNITLNKILKSNIEIIESALGDIVKIKDHRKSVKSMTLSEIKKICGGCDFLKIDCEGCEWEIKPNELKGIRRIEMEVHKIGRPFSEMEDMLREAGFKYKIKRRRGCIALCIVHAVNPSLD